MITDDMRAVIESATLCFAATVTPDGRPNVSPKGTIRVWDDTHLFFLDIASPKTRENLRHNANIELNVVETLSRRGYRFAGTARLYRDETAEYAEGVLRVYGERLPPPGTVATVVMVRVERAEPVLSPAYWRERDESAIRATWKERRRELDRTFDEHVKTHGAVRVDPETGTASLIIQK